MRGRVRKSRRGGGSSVKVRDVLAILIVLVVCGGLYLQYGHTLSASTTTAVANVEDGSGEIAGLKRQLLQESEQVETLTKEVADQEKREEELIKALGTLEKEVADAGTKLRAKKASSTVAKVLPLLQQKKVLPPAAAKPAATTAVAAKSAIKCDYQEGLDFKDPGGAGAGYQYAVEGLSAAECCAECAKKNVDQPGSCAVAVYGGELVLSQGIFCRLL